MNVGASGESFFILWEMRLGGIEANIEQAADSFMRRHNVKPNVCYYSSKLLDQATDGFLTAAGLQIKLAARNNVRPNTLQVGWEPGGAL